MTYSIIPPILVILSVIGILLFLMKKAPKVASLREVKDSEITGTGEKISPETKKGLISKDRFLVLMEKVTRRFKITFIRLENKFSSWNENIKKRRKQGGNVPGEPVADGGKEEVTVDQEKMPVAPMTNHIPEERRFEGAKRRKIYIGGEKTARPMVSEKIVAPRKAELKNRLERILIERIAANPKDIEAYERLGEYYFEIGNLEYSKDCFKQVIRLDSGNQNARSKMRSLENLLRR